MSEKQAMRAPDLGDFKQVPIIEVNLRSGESFEKEQTLLLLETEKATMEIPAPCAGQLLEWSVKVGDRISSGDILLYYQAAQSAHRLEPTAAPSPAPALPSAASPAVPGPAAPPAPVAAAPTPSAVAAALVHAGPATRRLAREKGVDLQQVVGTGRHGRIVRDDLLALEQKSSQKRSRIQQLTARNMHRNWTTIPHVTQFDQADITDCEFFRKEQNKRDPSVKLTLLVFVMKAVVQALKQFPDFHARLSDDGTELFYVSEYHLGIAVDTPQGLVVPVIRDVDQKGLKTLSLELAALSQKAREGRLTGAQMQGQSFTISSLGGVGGTAFTPIINAPDVAILGLSKMQWQPVIQDSHKIHGLEDLAAVTWSTRLLLPLSLSYDHRVIDGVQAARFSQYLAGLLGDIRSLLL